MKNYNLQFLFYDYETFGINTSLDKPSQFAYIRTDNDFNIIGSPKCLYCYPSIDYLPNPKALLITGITPQYTKKYGMNEFFFSKKIFKILNSSKTCILGYNNIKFDDEFTRNIFYRNFLDPYSWSWRNQNSRWDVILIIRACHVLFPKLLIWPKDSSGVISFRLEYLTKLNNIDHNAHDALSDVYATLELIKLIRNKIPELFNFLFQYRLKDNLKRIIHVDKYVPLIFISNIFGNVRNNVSCIIPIFWNTKNDNMLIFFDSHMCLKNCIQYLKNIDVMDITVKKLNSIGIRFLYVNQCPILIPLNFFTKKRLFCLGFDSNKFNIKINILKKNSQLINKIFIFFKNHSYHNVHNDVDLKIYDSFFCQYDRMLMKKIHNYKIHYWNNMKFSFLDKKLYEMFFRLKARNFPDLLNQKEKSVWIKHCLKYLNSENINKYLQEINNLIKLYRFQKSKLYLLLELKKYIYSIH
ncbi:exodeoxyribonuclease I [Buchnera aphidicola]|uniref:exodeoxyribonuclease I n=1 Tax=Buchnera aphidicola TaxID=9 RepID=UPI00346480D3